MTLVKLEPDYIPNNQPYIEKNIISTCLRVSWPALTWAHGVVASHPLRMRKALGSNPSVSRQGDRMPGGAFYPC